MRENKEWDNIFELNCACEIENERIHRIIEPTIINNQKWKKKKKKEHKSKVKWNDKNLIIYVSYVHAIGYIIVEIVL